MSADLESAVIDRYMRAAHEAERALCCPVSYDPRYLAAIPAEIIDRDYGCGDPSAFVHDGDIVLDLGCGGGKICFIASQIVGPTGRVIGIDMNHDMLALAERHRESVAANVGWSNVEFRTGRIQDLRLNLRRLDTWLAQHPVRSMADLARLDAETATLRREHPLVDDQSIDVVLSNCVLNLVPADQKATLFSELFRVVKVGGRVAISDIVSDEDVPSELQSDPELWSGCIAGALREDRFLDAFDAAGFFGMTLVKRDERPWRVVRGIEFRSVTVIAYKGKQGRCLERNQAVIYVGPWKTVTDDDGHVLERGRRMAVCDKTFRLYQNEPYAGMLIPVAPIADVPLEDAKPFDCRRRAQRQPRETKGLNYGATDLVAPVCEARSGCC